MKQWKIYLASAIIITMTLMLGSCLPKQNVSVQTFLLQQPKPKQDTLISTEIPTLYIENVIVTAPFDSLNFIFKIKPSNYQVDYYHRFLSTPSEQLAAIFTTKLDALANVKIVSSMQTANYLLKIKLNKFYINNTTTPKQAVINLSIQLVSQNDTAKLFWWHDYQQNIAIKDYYSGAQNLVLAWDKGINIILQQSTKEIVKQLPKQPRVPKQQY